MFERILMTIIIACILGLTFTLTNRYHGRQISRVVKQSEPEKRPRLLFFHGSGCSACVQQEQYLAQLDPVWRPLIESIHVEQDPDLVQKYKVLTIPMTILIGRDQSVQQINYGLTRTPRLIEQLNRLN
ncbi:MAG: hypothetical protein QNJ45_04645 [Ardenticatenaceae bacterium]|nr:hypothetical protein [Ardenticatenaceae bacterium]